MNSLLTTHYSPLTMSGTIEDPCTQVAISHSRLTIHAPHVFGNVLKSNDVSRNFVVNFPDLNVGLSISAM